MGKRGPPPGPTALKILRGNPGKRPLNDQEPQPESGLPRCPDALTGVARDTWNQFAGQLGSCGVGTQLDAAALQLLCEATARYSDAAAKAAQFGPVWITPGKKGEPPIGKISPYVRVMDREREFIARMMREFGMTPSSRSSVKVDKPRA